MSGKIRSKMSDQKVPTCKIFKNASAMVNKDIHNKKQATCIFSHAVRPALIG